MRITIGDKSRECMDLLGLTAYPFSSDVLKTAFRARLKIVHPDKDHGDHDKAVAVIAAYKHLKNLAFDLPEEAKYAIPDEDDGDIFKLWETCPECLGRRFRTFHNHRMPCPSCNYGPFASFLWGLTSRPGTKTFRCNRCGGTGKFSKDGVEKGVCFKCNGKGRVELTCRDCGGTGWLGQDKTETRPCSNCKGKGKIELDPWNPVIPKGAVLK